MTSEERQIPELTIYFLGLAFLIPALIYNIDIIVNYINYITDNVNLFIFRKRKKTTYKEKTKVALLTNEIPPIVYGGVATWIVNFIKMFENDSEYDIIPVYLAFQDQPVEEFSKYKNLRIIYNMGDIEHLFNDIDICINNIWINLEIIKDIKQQYPDLNIISVCHSLIQMEHLTNQGSQYEITWKDQEVTFEYSDFVVLISNAERKYYNQFGYNKFRAKPVVIYNSYKPKYDNVVLDIDYSSDDPGFIGRHVPRKRPELPLLAVQNLNKKNVQIFNMGVDFKNGRNTYWENLNKKNKILTIYPFTTDSKIKNKYWKNIGVNCITGIYEPFGYTICETLDRRVPCIVQNIDGPKEIISDFKDYVITYDVDIDMKKDVDNFSKALNQFWQKSKEERKLMAEKARKSLDKFRPENIKLDWINLFQLMSN
tara:strand:+ start:552 stop:1829 length:1278 start_codon:yes stop_codon:yes gene_type:complete